MKILVLNCGSSSIRYALRDTDMGAAEANGLVSRIGEDESRIDFQSRGMTHSQECPIPGHGQGLELIVETLLDPATGVLKDITEVSAVGHRVVHGGTYFTASAPLTPQVIAKIEEYAHLAPLHNPPILQGIREALRLLPRTPQVAVFDTAFHATMPPQAYLYALPYKLSQDHGIRRYGFHGISLASVCRKTDRFIGGRLAQLKAVIAHLGNGASITAVAEGRSVDTSMGLTPLEGLVMGTRPGDLDPGLVIFLMRDLGLSVDTVDALLNKESGLLGLSGVSNDMRDVEAAAAQGDERCRLALEIYAYRIRKYIGAYAAAMGGLDLLVFTAGVGENDSTMRATICEGLQFLGISLDAAANAATQQIDRDISTPGSAVRVLVIPTDEEAFIAEETASVIMQSHAQP